MPSGRKLTTSQIVTILELLGLRGENGRYLLSQTAVAEAVDVHRRTVSRVLRDAAVRAGERLRQDFSDNCVDKVTLDWLHTPYDP